MQQSRNKRAGFACKFTHGLLMPVVLSQLHCPNGAGQVHIRRGVIAGFYWGFAGLVGTAVGIAASTFDRDYDLQFNMARWLVNAFPTAIVVIPMLLFFTGVVTHTPTRHVGFAKNLAILTITTLPLAGILGALGMDPHRDKPGTPPLITISEVLMFLLPITTISLLLIKTRLAPLPEEESSTTESLPLTATTTEPAHAPEPAVGPDSNGESSTPAR